jgi:hypothetical protein
MEVKPHKQIVVKVDVSWRLTLRNRRFVRELDPRKTSLEDYQVHSGAASLFCTCTALTAKTCFRFTNWRVAQGQ